MKDDGQGAVGKTRQHAEASPHEESARGSRLPIVLLGCLLFLAARWDGGQARSTPLRRSSGVRTREVPAPQRRPVAASGAASGPGRLFRRYQDVARVPADEGSDGASVYERLWPGESRYRWAGKKEGLRGARAPAGRELCFVHVGKTGGSSVG